MNLSPALRTAIEKAGQAHLLAYDSPQLADQLAAIDWENLPRLIADYVLKKPDVQIPADVQPAPYFPLVPRTAEEKAEKEKAEALGIEMLKSGKVACLTVAGGQGTRLGFDAPKGTYPIGPVSGRTLFEYFAQSIARAEEKYGAPIRWYVMTSALNRQATEEFFRERNNLGLREDQVFFFTQGTMPAIGYDGKILMSSPDSLALSPDGHGGTLLALRKSGALEQMKQDGVEYISYFQVDNPLVPVVNPLFIGMHALRNSEMSAIMLAKTNAFEKLGNFCVCNGRLQIIEYSDLPAELAESTNPDGTLRFISGSPAIHVISREFVEQLTLSGRLDLPWHRADKKIPSITDPKPEQPNGVKLESFIFDALSLARTTLVLEGDRAEMFAPTKNPTGVDSVESCREMLIARDIRRLRAAGITVEDGAKIEIDPRKVLDDADGCKLAAELGLTAIRSGIEMVIG
ncbi:MAG: UDPGP type 1 family protein [Lentisphaerae bacterium]|nr:UDPGP type 1 family protein [Lentisphaerota bacterium]MBR2873571.1 UTP--glucose-1-phosphate uridylyltransferase [Lentisphaeria bacterium]